MGKHLFTKGMKMPKEHSERTTLRNLINNPMSNPETIEKMRQTKLKKYRDGIIIAGRLGKKHSENTKDRISEASKEYQKDRKLSKEERRKVVNARVKAQKRIALKSSCEICGSIDNLQRHHWNYEKPLMVNTLCQNCHEIQHVKNFYDSKFGGRLQLQFA